MSAGGCSQRAPDTHGIDLVQDLPLFVGHAEGLRCLDGSLHLTGPHLQLANTLQLDEATQLLRKLNQEKKKKKKKTLSFLLIHEAEVGESCEHADCVHLFASGRETRVSANPTLDVELALTVAAQVDGARRDVNVHEVVDDPALDVVQHSVDQVPLAHVHDFDVGEIPEGSPQTHTAFPHQRAGMSLSHNTAVQSSARFIV